MSTEWTEEELQAEASMPCGLLVDMRLVRLGVVRTAAQYGLQEMQRSNPLRFTQQLASLEKAYGEQMARRAVARGRREEKVEKGGQNNERVLELIRRIRAERKGGPE